MNASGTAAGIASEKVGSEKVGDEKVGDVGSVTGKPSVRGVVQVGTVNMTVIVKMTVTVTVNMNMIMIVIVIVNVNMNMIGSRWWLVRPSCLTRPGWLSCLMPFASNSRGCIGEVMVSGVRAGSIKSGSGPRGSR